MELPILMCSYIFSSPDDQPPLWDWHLPFIIILCFLQDVQSSLVRYNQPGHQQTVSSELSRSSEAPTVPSHQKTDAIPSCCGNKRQHISPSSVRKVERSHLSLSNAVYNFSIWFMSFIPQSKTFIGSILWHLVFINVRVMTILEPLRL